MKTQERQQAQGSPQPAPLMAKPMPIVDDTRPAATAQRRIQGLAETGPRTALPQSVQAMMEGSPQVRQLRSSQAMMSQRASLSSSRSRVAQLRSFNPYAASDGSTGHHIIPHSVLKKKYGAHSTG